MINQAKYIRNKLAKKITNEELKRIDKLVEQVVDCDDDDDCRHYALEELEEAENDNPILWENKIMDDLGTVYNMKDGSIKVRGVKDES